MDACAYCQQLLPQALVHCDDCDRWFCNLSAGTAGLHAVSHMAHAGHRQALLHRDLAVGDIRLECYHCGARGLFTLGYVQARTAQVMVFLCRMPCAQVKDANWDGGLWLPLVSNRALVPWLVAVPSGEELEGCDKVTQKSAALLEALWNKTTVVEGVPLPQVPAVFNSTAEYQTVFAPLVEQEAATDKAASENMLLGQVTVTWTKESGEFVLPYRDLVRTVAVGDELALELASGWKESVVVARVSENTCVVELKGVPPPVETLLTATLLWKATPFDRMHRALAAWTSRNTLSKQLTRQLLGHAATGLRNTVLPRELLIPAIAALNPLQAAAVRHALTHRLLLIQGPPGTGKTTTSATIAVHMSAQGKVLVCAPLNVAADHLTAVIARSGVNVIRVLLRARCELPLPVEHLTLHYQARKTATGKLKQMLAQLHQLLPKQLAQLHYMLGKLEAGLVAAAAVVCTTCIGAGDPRLKKAKFPYVLVDEVLMAPEPQLLVPLVKGAHACALVGDHCQLGPVVLDKLCRDAGFGRLMYQRLVDNGTKPLRLEVQYRMHPGLAEFSLEEFYEGALHNGVAAHERVWDVRFPWPTAGLPNMFWANYGQEELAGSGTLYLNRVEALNVVQVVTHWLNNGVAPDDIGVITPYIGQRLYIEQYMATTGGTHGVEIALVDAFQGREKAFVVFLCVRAGSSHIGFLSDPRRLNVALTRAKYGLVVMGNPQTLKKNPLWRRLLRFYAERGALVEGPLEGLRPTRMALGEELHAGSNPEDVELVLAAHMASMEV